MSTGIAFDVAIALVAVYLLVAILSSAVIEWFNSWSNRRGRGLLSLIEQLVGTEMTKRLFQGPRISAFCLRGTERLRILFPFRTRSPIESRLLPDGTTLAPSYIPSVVFAEALAAEICGGQLLLGEPTPDDLASAIYRVPVPTTPTPNVIPFERSRIESLVREAAVHCASGQSELTFFRSFKRETERWFDDANDRLVEEYKRRSQASLLVVAVVIALVLNANTFNIVDAVMRNADLRETVSSLTHLVGGATKPAISAAAPTTNIAPIPLGWPLPLWIEGCPPLAITCGFIHALIGILITAIAGSLGAPFWFDALNKLVNLRVAASRPPSSTTDRPPPRVGVLPNDNSANFKETAVPAAAPRAATPATIGDFQFSHLGLSIANAAFLARCAKLSYVTDPASLKLDLAKVWPKCSLESFDSGKSTQAFVASDEKLIVVAFRGTEKRLEDVLADAKFGLTGANSPYGQCHLGFLDALAEIWEQVCGSIKQLAGSPATPPRELWFTGHSLGAALATLAAARCVKDGRTVHGVYTFGSPRVGDKTFQTAFHEALLNRTQRFANLQDGVARIPLWTMGYRHVGQDAYLDGGNRAITGQLGWVTSLLDTAIGGASSPGQLPRQAVVEHSMDLYIERLERIRAAASS